MKKQLDRVDRRINIKDYSLKEIAEYFEKFNNYICVITTEKEMVKFKIYKDMLPHLLGLQHIFNSNYCKGIKGFAKLKNEEITYKDIVKKMSSKKNKEIVDNINRRIEYLPMFFNTFENKTKLKIIDKNNIFRNTLLKGNYAFYKMEREKNKFIYPLLSIKKINKKLNVIETFIIESDITLLGALKEEKILNIELIPPKLKENAEV